MMAADNKIWVIALFMLISFVFNWLKKKRQQQSVDSEGFDGDESIDKGDSWGISDIIEQFEVEYNGGQSKQSSDNGFVTPVNELENDKSNPTVKDRAKEVVVDDEVLKTVRPNAYKNQEGEDPEGENRNYDLKEMIISTTILNRPDF